jgi:hypothetical protein
MSDARWFEVNADIARAFRGIIDPPEDKRAK